VAFVNEQRPNLGKSRIVMLAALRSDMVTIPEPERYGISGWIMRNDARATIEEAVNKAVAGA
jgi:hypothetical protein